MTFPAITADGQTNITGGVKYISVLLEQRWKRAALVPNYATESITERMISNGEITPAKLNLSLTFATAPPGTPTVGPKYLVRATATGAWAGHENSIATWDGSAWVFTAPVEGMLAWDATADLLYAYTGSAWVVVNEYTLPDRLSGGGDEVTNWNDATSAGFYWSGPTATNGPTSTLFASGYVTQIASENSVEQVVSVWDGIATTSLTYSRQLYDGVWTSWVARNLTSTEVSTLISTAITTTINTPEKLNTKVISASTINPPGSPANGDRYIVGANATGLWFAHDKQLAVWNATTAAWDFTTLTEGAAFWVADVDRWMVYDGTSLIIVGPQPNNQAFRFQYRLVDSVGAVFGPLNSDTDYNGQPWTAVFPAANLGSGTLYYGVGTNVLISGTAVAASVSVNVGPEAQAIRSNGDNLWLYSASYTASASPYVPGDYDPRL